MSKYRCSVCGSEAYYDGRCGDGPILVCGCDKGRWINDGRGGYHENPTGAHAIEEQYWDGRRRRVIIIDEYEDWDW